MVSRKMRYASLAGVGLMTLSLVACASEEQSGAVIGDSLESSMEQNGIQTINNTDNPQVKQCREYELQDDGSYMCDDDDNEGSGGVSGAGMFWFFNGHTYSSHNAMVSSSDYKKNNLKSGTKYSSKSTDGTKNKNSKNSKSNNAKNSSKSGGSNGGKSTGKSGGFGSGARGGSSGGS